tara:strand:+ start:2314 stop:2916 length:603 start_codon:yes stop_codon:yes gene_type:complete
MQFKLSKEQNEKLKAFSVEVIERNKLHNLTGYKNPQNFFNEQIIDSVTALRACRKSLQDDIVDCGSGAGVPAIVWAIMDPQKTLHSIDKNQKKIHFQNKMINKLNLSNIGAHHTRIEDYALEKPHTVVLKAFSSIYKSLTLLRSRNQQKNFIFIKKADKKTEEELLQVPALLYDYKKHQYALNKEKMVAIELYDSKNSHN